MSTETTETTETTRTSARKRKPKPRVHREWFRTVMDKRKSCPTCGSKLEPGESVWSWGEYVRGKWRTVMHFCKRDWEPTKTEVWHNGVSMGVVTIDAGIKEQLRQHAGGCGCAFELVGYQGQKLPEWMTLGKEVCDATSKV